MEQRQQQQQQVNIGKHVEGARRRRRTIKGDDMYLCDNDLNVYGNNNVVEGDGNHIFGNNNTAIGDRCIIYSKDALK